MSFKRVSAKEAHDLVANEGYVYVDVRSITEFAMGHPKGAFNVPFMHLNGGSMEPNKEFVAVMQKAFSPEHKIVIGCKAGGRSMKAAEMLNAAGFTNIIDQKAGYSGQTDAFGRVSEPGWSTEGLPTSMVPEGGRDYDALSKR